MGDSGLVVYGRRSDYLGLFKPRPSFLLTFTGFTVYAFASGWADLVNIMVFFVFGFLAALGSNALNNYFDKDTDALMSRTMGRPLPRGLVKPLHAFLIGILMIAVSAVTFSIWFNPLSAGLIILGSVYYSLFYTIYLKRRTSMNTVIGGFAGSLPILTGWIAATGSVSTEAILLALIVFLWTPGHFWSLALKFKDDYQKAGLPMLTSVIDIRVIIKWIIFFNLMSVLSIGLSVLMITPVIYRLLASAALLMIITSSILIYMESNEFGAWKAYKISSPALGLVFTGLLLSFI